MTATLGPGTGVGRASRYMFIATAGQVTFSGADNSAALLTLGYTPNAVEVIVNGVWLPPQDYTAADGSSVVLGNGCIAGDIVYVYALSTFSIPNAVMYSNSQALTAAQQAQAQANIAAAPYEAESFNNILINGGMEVDQEHAGASSTVASGYGVDGWRVTKAGTMVCTVQQVADAPPGFSNSLKITVGTAEASLGSSDRLTISQPLEGYRVSNLAFGGSSAQSVTLGFWTKIHRAGLYSGTLQNDTLVRTIAFTFTQNVADTWEYKTVTLPGDITGTWIGNTNALALTVLFCMAVGTGSAGTAGAWGGSGLYGATGSTNGVAATTDVFQITGVSLLPGTVAPSSTTSVNLKRSYDQELRLCQRYLEVSNAAATTLLAIGFAYNTSVCMGYYAFKVTKRAVPAFTAAGAGSDYSVYRAGVNNPIDTVPSMDSATIHSAHVRHTHSTAPFTAGQGLMLYAATTTAQYKFDARL